MVNLSTRGLNDFENIWTITGIISGQIGETKMLYTGDRRFLIVEINTYLKWEFFHPTED